MKQKSQHHHHMLSGGSFIHFIHLLFICRIPITRKNCGAVLSILFTTCLLLPLSFFEFIFYHRGIKNIVFQKPPVFIIGHWRSGTTFLHNLLAEDNRFHAPTNFQVFLPGVFLTGKNWLKKIQVNYLPTTRPMDSMPLLPDLPQEEEFGMALTNIYSPYTGFVFPSLLTDNFNKYVMFEGASEKEKIKWKRRYYFFLQKLTYRYQHKQLLLKNPANTTRINELLQIFPAAQFVYIERNAIDVIPSTQNMFLKIMELNSLQGADSHSIASFIAVNHEKILQKYHRIKKAIPEGNLIEIEFTKLIADPAGIKKDILSRLKF